MGIEQIITEELASISMTLGEMSAIANLINGEIKNEAFITPFSEVIEEISKSYDVVIENLLPFTELVTEESFMEKFDELATNYKECYLKEISKPRIYADEAYEQYLVLQSMKECKTRFPLLKRTFTRFDEFIDKWVTNDAWLAMGIDNLFKRLPHLLNEVTGLKQNDPDDAFVIYHSAFSTFKIYLDVISQQRQQLGMQNNKVAVAV
ncbi:MAG: hypothetical protein P8Y24_06375 [Gammaproteobacteria bacterium]